MTKHKIEYDCKCPACGGAGVYSGLGERDGFAVVCHACKGKGEVHRIYEYEDFEGRAEKPGIIHVVATNPGICLGLKGEDQTFVYEDFGGMPYKDWLEGKPFPDKSENRKSTCPAWWYQSADYEKKPNWEECMGAGSFSVCKKFSNKDECWDKWDKENGEVK